MKRLNLFLAVLAVSLSFSVSAHTNIDAVIEQLKKDSNAKVVYSEKRNPTTKKPYKMSLVITFTNDAMGKKLQDAFDKDQKDAVEVSSINNSLNQLVFRDGTCKREYTLKRKDKGAKWMLAVEIKDDSQRSKSMSMLDYDADYEAVFGNYGSWETIDSLLKSDSVPKFIKICNKTGDNARKARMEARKKAKKDRAEARKARVAKQKEARAAYKAARKAAAKAYREALRDAKA